MIDIKKILKLLRMNLVIHIFILLISVFILSSFIYDLQVVDMCKYYDKLQTSANTGLFLENNYKTELSLNYILFIGVLMILVLEESFRLMKVYRLIREVENEKT